MRPVTEYHSKVSIAMWFLIGKINTMLSVPSPLMAFFPLIPSGLCIMKFMITYLVESVPMINRKL